MKKFLSVVLASMMLMRRTIRRNGLNTEDGQKTIALCRKHISEALAAVDSLDF